ncbi:MAG TPA: hypothetical protein VHW96_19730 [Solirubrobacteraceae bacterium]|jgi:hypothetical protein|nr:hypothetical protein [Solirubrobacteraceae bacterium]
MTRPRLLVVAHDAGSAEIVSAWLRRERDQWAPELVLDGPATPIFERKLGPEIPRLAQVPPPHGFTFVLCGSSGTSPLERRTVRAARGAGVRCAVWLDHWTNFPERFTLQGELVLPDEVWVADAEAEKLARAQLPQADVRLKGNPYLEDFVTEVRASEPAEMARSAPGDGERILYVTEPTSVAAERVTGDPRGWGYTEREALAGYLAKLGRRVERRVRLRLRTHPAEPAGKYDDLLAAVNGVTLDRAPGASLAQDIAWAQTVVGCETMAMVAALAAGRRVLSALPAGSLPSSIPLSGIGRLD